MFVEISWNEYTHMMFPLPENALATASLMQDRPVSAGRTAPGDVCREVQPTLRRLNVPAATARPLLPLPRALLHLAQNSLLWRLTAAS
ncbi:MAG: hypothetical protein JNN30_10185 [Rhodanobacteraceae bacterium]|nr:hypothetical protein [Rhodanobacteraceae bacterium]